MATTKRNAAALRYMGYTHYPHRVNRPHCDLCGPFAAPFLRRIGSDEFGPLHRCVGCDEE